MTQADTRAEARAVQLIAYRAMGPARRLAAAFEMSQEARQIAVAGMRARHPDWSDAAIEHAVVELMLGRRLAQLIEPAAPRR